MFCGLSMLCAMLGPGDHRSSPRNPRTPPPVEAPKPSSAYFDGVTSAEGLEAAPCIFQPGVSGMVKVELTTGDRAKLQIRIGKAVTDLPIRAGNTLVTMLPPEGSLSLIAGKGQSAEVHWIFFPHGR